jgi:N12 class adenine-specific DNA methylase
VGRIRPRRQRRHPCPAAQLPGHRRVPRPRPRLPVAARARRLRRRHTQTATKAAIFDRRVIRQRTPLTRVTDPADAVAVCLDRHGRVDLTVIADLLGRHEDAALAALGDRVFTDPATGELTLSGRYLSGQVRTKLDTARAAAATDSRFDRNVTALTAVQPAPLEPGDIHLSLGATWITEDEIRAFITDTLGPIDRLEVTLVPRIGWIIDAPASTRSGTAMTSQWGTQRMDALTIVKAVMRQEVLQVRDRDRDPDTGRTWVNLQETQAVLERAAALQDAFGAWAWDTDPDRARTLADRYNDRYNAWVTPDHDGAFLTTPGLVDGFALRDHQATAVARILHDGNALLGHVVGAGKTAEMVVAGMEMRRLGLVTKPLYVVPNHMVEQFAREFRQLYPAADVLVPIRKETTKAGRVQFAARCATGDWDAVIISESLFTRIPVPTDVEVGYRETQLADYRDTLERLKASHDHRGGSRSKSIKEVEKALPREEAHLELLRDKPTDDGVTFDQLGVDYLFIDEAHRFKNLRIITANRELADAGSKKATDLHLKLTWLREQRGDGRVVTFATGTPVANRIAELYVMQTYLQPDTLAAVGVDDFDLWAAQFGEIVTRPELDPSGAGWRLKSRFARYRNVPELMRLFGQVADIRLAADLDLPTPTVTGGQPEVVVVPATAQLDDYVADLVARADKVRSRAVTPDQDNMLAITGDGRRAALHLGLVGRDQPEPSKITAAADRIAQTWAANADRTYIDPAATGDPHPAPARVRSCSATSAPSAAPATSASTTTYATRSSTAASPPTRSPTSTTPATTPPKPTCSPAAATAASRCSSAPPRRWASAPTSRPDSPRCTTSTPPGGPPTSTNAKAASCGRVTRTPK